MKPTMPESSRSVPVRSSDFPRPTTAKAVLQRSDVGQVSDTLPTMPLGDVVKAAVVSYYGGVQEAAYALGEGAGRAPLDPSQMVREFQQGKLARLDADAVAKSVVAQALHRAFVVDDPKAKARQILRETVTRLHELDQLIDEVA